MRDQTRSLLEELSNISFKKDKENVVAKANYGFDFDAVVSCDNVHGIQCHPEKSHHWGFQLLKNFAEI